MSRAILVSTVHGSDDAVGRLGMEAYSYYFVARAFLPFLQRLGETSEITRAESRLDFAVRTARERGLAPLHLSFLPLHAMYLGAHAPNVAFPFWEFPDLPRAFGNNPRNDWARIADHLDLILTASRFTADTFARAGVRTPVRVVPVPLAPAYFAVPAWEPGQRVVLEHPAYVLPTAPVPNRDDDDAFPDALERGGALTRMNTFYLNEVKPRLPGAIARSVTSANKRLSAWRHGPGPLPPMTNAQSLVLDGIVYTTIVNPFDPRKNWQDTLSAFLLALGDRADATLVVKVVAATALARQAVDTVLGAYRAMGIRHRARVALVSSYLPDDAMVTLARASTYYVNTARAEGACLPVQELLAAGRPALAPCHTALADYFNASLGFVIDSHPEPAAWPHDPSGRYTTRWHRIVWQSLHDQFVASYRTAHERLADYRALAERGRAAMARLASAEAVERALRAALDEVALDAQARRALRE